jgi:hypothetical protein
LHEENCLSLCHAVNVDESLGNLQADQSRKQLNRDKPA